MIIMKNYRQATLFISIPVGEYPSSADQLWQTYIYIIKYILQIQYTIHVLIRILYVYISMYMYISI